MCIITILVLIVLSIYVLSQKPENFTILPQLMACSRYLDTLPRHGYMSASGAIKWVSNRPLKASDHCQKVFCHPPLSDVSYWYCPYYRKTPTKVPATVEAMQNTRYVIQTDRRFNVVRHLVIDKFNRIQSIHNIPPLPTPGNKCIQRTCPPEYNMVQTCWDCDQSE